MYLNTITFDAHVTHCVCKQEHVGIVLSGSTTMFVAVTMSGTSKQ